jgi:putrescine transport system substrate-binding protein
MGRVNRLALTAMALAVLALAACGPAAKPGSKAASNDLHIYNWSDYIGPTTVDDFKKETGLNVTYDTFDSNEMLEGKILTGHTGYDLVVPSNHILPRLIAAGALMPLDRAKLPNFKNLSPDLLAKMNAFDPGSKYSVPYMWGTMGVGYNKDAIAKRLPGVKLDSWSVVFDPANLAKLADCGVYFLDAPEDMYAVVLKYMGKDPNSTNPADYAAATDLLTKLRPYIRKFHSSEYINALANGDACVVVGYSGDVLQAKSRADEAGGKVKVAYMVPKEGSQVWFDVFVIPVDAGNPDGAHRFLDYLLRPEVIAKASDFVQYANANQAATPLVDKAVRDNPDAYPPPDVYARLFVTSTKAPDLLRIVNRDWLKVTTGR